MRILFILATFVYVTGSANLMAQKTEHDANYHFKSNSFSVALKLYTQLQAKDSTNPIYNYRLGICHLYTNHEPWKALKHLQLIEEGQKNDPQFYFELGRAYLYNYEFENALASFEKCARLSGKNQKIIDIANLWLKMTLNAQSQVNKPLDITFINMGKGINSAMDEISPAISPDGELLVYTSNQKYDAKLMLYTNSIYLSNSDDGVFEKSKAVAIISNLDDEFVAGFSRANDKLFVQPQGYEAFQDIVAVERVGKGFKTKTFLNENVNSKGPEIAATESQNSDTLFFSSDRTDGLGGMDIYYSLKLPTGEWGMARNCGNKINTAYDEDFPQLSDDGSQLYFCSNGVNSMGGYDIFKSTINSTTREFTSPVNIGYPLNNVFDNKTIAFSPDQRYAYISGCRPEGFGHSDLYRVVFNQEDPSVKILMVSLKTGTPEAKTDFNVQDSTIKVTAYSKGKIVFGTYKYDLGNKQVTLALPPGSYTIEIQGETIEEIDFKITIPDVASGSKVERKDVFVKPKK
jgi:tetratricopeptide (TPR) repeat protein